MYPRRMDLWFPAGPINRLTHRTPVLLRRVLIFLWITAAGQQTRVHPSYRQARQELPWGLCRGVIRGPDQRTPHARATGDRHNGQVRDLLRVLVAGVAFERVV